MFSHPIYNSLHLVTQAVKNLPKMWKTQVQSLGWEDHLEKGMAGHSCLEFFPGEFHGQKSLVDYGPWGCKELDTTKQLSALLAYY